MLDASVGTAALEVMPGGSASHIGRPQLFVAAEAVAELLARETFAASTGTLDQLDVTSRILGPTSAGRVTAVAFLQRAPELLLALAAVGVDVAFDIDVAIIDDEGTTMAEAASTWLFAADERPAA